MQTLHECDLSIIIPVYNLERFIEPMLRSLAEQKHGYKVETIFVLNNCTDRSEELIKGHGNIIHCKTQGCGAARNAGLEIAKGKYVWFMDGDDWLLKDTAIQEAMDLVQGKQMIRIPFISNRFPGSYFSMVWQYVMARDLIGDLRFPNIQPGEDDAFMEVILDRVKLNARVYKQLPHTDPLYFYNYLREGSNMYRALITKDLN